MSEGRMVFSRPPGHSGAVIPVACGQCLGCLLSRRQMWLVRGLCESMLHDANSFVTFTYDDEHLPRDMNLSLRTYQLLIKRLRKALRPAEIRYQANGEYGDATSRPHYHMTAFGMGLPEDCVVWSQGKGGAGALYTSESLDKVWGLGRVLIAESTPQTIAYVAAHQLKDLVSRVDRKQPYMRVDVNSGELRERVRPFRTQSNRPGIGGLWFERYWRDVFPHGLRLQSVKWNTPRYFWKLLKRRDPALFDELWAKRVEAAKSDEFRAENTAARLAVRAVVRSAKLRHRRPADEQVEALPVLLGVDRFDEDFVFDQGVVGAVRRAL